ncbi:hypothetical protein QUF70_16195 [Desulfobacterales bacterium HSG17]|nr:hypothetical protein [Desulfobacterales bacterium HSG17]
MNSAFKPKRVTRTHVQKIEAPSSKVFPLLCPVREYDWIEIWKCNIIWSESGVAENNCIFTTDFPDRGGLETWTVSRYEENRAIEFVIISQDFKAAKLDIHLTDNGDNTTDARWTRTITGLSDDGNKYVENFSSEHFIHEMKLLEQMMNHYLKTGKMLKIMS